MKTLFFGAVNVLSLLVTALSMTHAAAQAPVRPDKIMTIAELRACMMLELANKKTAADILQTQEAFTRDQAAVKAEQAAVEKANDAIRTDAATITAEQDVLTRLLSALAAKKLDAKTDEQKADVEAERVKLVERNRRFETNVDAFNAAQQAQGDRIKLLNERVGAINQRNQTVNDQVEPHQKQAALWRQQCGSRRFREDDEIAIKKEWATAK